MMVRSVPATGCTAWAGLVFGSLVTTAGLVVLVTGRLGGHGPLLLGTILFGFVLLMGWFVSGAIEAASCPQSEEPVPPELDFFD